ncbi:site-specific integrase [Erwinia typographi]|uniref:site-specific integrase n=1 Tax=Erwinia typographi TaxID=371042 RepID=UPI00068C1B6E|nr:site-specific integrase [Erwinia typographi]
MGHLPREISQNSRSALSPPGGYARAVRLREMAMAAGLDVPRYLLAPEVAVLLRCLPDLRQRMLIDTLWNTGARINEALALTPSDFFFNADMPFVRLRTLKQRAPRARGRPTREQRLEVPFRALPLPDGDYVRRMQEFFATFRLMTRRATPVWSVASQETPRNWIRAAVRRAEQDGVIFSVRPVTPHTFRHSYAVHLLMNGVHIKQVQALMGHRRLENTEVYTRLFALDVTPDLTFSMSPDSALELLGLSPARHS